MTRPHPDDIKSTCAENSPRLLALAEAIRRALETKTPTPRVLLEA